jgi:uncharacterized protein YrrD
MTRTEFNRRHAAALATTQGFTAAALAEINDAIFALVSEDISSEIDAVHDETEDDEGAIHQIVSDASESVFNAHTAIGHGALDVIGSDRLLAEARAARLRALEHQRRVYPHLF